MKMRLKRVVIIMYHEEESYTNASVEILKWEQLSADIQSVLPHDDKYSYVTSEAGYKIIQWASRICIQCNNSN